jgi:hypothetical protein
MAEEKLIANIVPPFALNDGELSGILNFASENGLDEICKMVAELKTLRKLHLEQCRQIGILTSRLADQRAQKIYAEEIEEITNAAPKS